MLTIPLPVPYKSVFRRDPPGKTQQERDEDMVSQVFFPKNISSHDLNCIDMWGENMNVFAQKYLDGVSCTWYSFAHARTLSLKALKSPLEFESHLDFCDDLAPRLLAPMKSIWPNKFASFLEDMHAN